MGMEEARWDVNESGRGSDEASQRHALAVWETQALNDVSVKIKCYLSENPAPARGGIARSLASYADRFAELAEERLEELGVSRLRVVREPTDDGPPADAS